MKVLVKGKGEVELSQSNYVAQGGEGSIYAKGGIAYKVYADPSKIIPAGKIQELSQISNPNVIKPEEIIVDKKNTPVGYTMRFVPKTNALCQIFTRAFRERNGLDAKKMLELVQQFQSGVVDIHKAGVLIVDLNEMNFLIDDNFEEIFFIDVDSYQTKHYHATALMESVRDYQSPVGQFTEMSDWFSFAVVSFQMFVGIHPYKGKHPKVKGLEDRMKGNISVFNPEVRMPNACYPLDVIPDVYRAWYKSVLEDGNRSEPPFDLRAAAIFVPTVRSVHGTVVNITEIEEFGHPVIFFTDHFGTQIVCLNNGDVNSGKRVLHKNIQNFKGLGFTPRMNTPVVASLQSGGKLDLSPAPQIPLQLHVDAVMSYDGRIYARSTDKIVELVFNDINNKVFASYSQVVANCLEHSTKVFPGVVIQDLLGSAFVSIFPRSGASYQNHLPELDGLKVIEAEFDHGVLMVMTANSSGQYDRFVFRFDQDTYSKYDVRKVADVDLAAINFVTLDSGVCVCINEDEKVELFSSKMGSSSMKVLEDPAIGGDMVLYRQGGRVIFARGNKLYRMEMK